MSGFAIRAVLVIGLFQKSLFADISKWPINAERPIRSFFLTMLFRAYLVPLINLFGFKLAKVIYEEVDMG